MVGLHPWAYLGQLCTLEDAIDDFLGLLPQRAHGLMLVWLLLCTSCSLCHPSISGRIDGGRRAFRGNWVVEMDNGLGEREVCTHQGLGCSQSAGTKMGKGLIEWLIDKHGLVD